MKYFLLMALVIVSITLQTTVFNFLKVAGVKPDLVLVIVVAFSLVKGSKKGAIFGFVAGFLIDMTTGSFLGLNAFVKMVTGYLVGLGETNVYKEHLLIPILAVFTASLLNEFLLYLLHSWYGYESSIFIVLVREIFPVAIYNTALIPIFYSLFHRIILKLF